MIEKTQNNNIIQSITFNIYKIYYFFICVFRGVFEFTFYKLQKNQIINQTLHFMYVKWPESSFPRNRNEKQFTYRYF